MTMRSAAIVAIAAICASMLLIFVAPAAEVTLNPAERANCDRQGGCEVVSNAWMRAQLKAAFDLGFQAGIERVEMIRSCKPPTI